MTVSQPLCVLVLPCVVGGAPQVAQALANKSAKAKGSNTDRTAAQRATCQGTTLPGTIASSKGTIKGTNTRSK